MIPIIIVLCVVVIGVFYFLRTIKEEENLALEAQEVLEQRLLDRFFILWVASFVLSLWGQVFFLPSPVSWRWLTFSVVSFFSVNFVIWYRGLISRATATHVLVIGMSSWNLIRSFVSRSKLAMHPQFAFYYLFGIIIGERPILIVLVFGLTNIGNLLLPEISAPWITMEELNGMFGQFYGICCGLIAIMMIYHMMRDGVVRASALRNHARSVQRLLETVSHEIRTPLNVIIGSMQLMTMDEGMNKSPRARKDRFKVRVEENKNLTLNLKNEKETFRSATQAALMLNLVVNNVMAQYKGVDSRLRAQNVNSNEFLCGLETLLEGLAIKKNLRVQVRKHEMPIEFNVDVNSLLQVIINLVSNAVKFQDDGLILVSISVSKESKMLEIEVADEGCGVSQKFVEQGLIFKPFSRDESSSFQIGSGLGLSICKKLVENDLGGEIGYRPNSPRGSVFWLSLPLKDDFINRWSFGDSGWFVSAERAKSESMQVVSSEDWPCLVCDDSSLNQSVFVQFFKKMGVNNPSVADEGASALQWLLQHAKTEKEGRRPFVLIDMSMPVLNGLESVEMWRELESRLRLPRACICLVSAMSEKVDSPLFDFCLKKPLLFPDLMSVFKNFRSHTLK